MAYQAISEIRAQIKSIEAELANPSAGNLETLRSALEQLRQQEAEFDSNIKSDFAERVRKNRKHNGVVQTNEVSYNVLSTPDSVRKAMAIAASKPARRSMFVFDKTKVYNRDEFEYAVELLKETDPSVRIIENGNIVGMAFDKSKDAFNWAVTASVKPFLSYELFLNEFSK